MILAGDDADGDVEEVFAAQEGRQRLVGVHAAAMQVTVAVCEQLQAVAEGCGAQGQLETGQARAECVDRGCEDGLHPHRARGDAVTSRASTDHRVELFRGGVDLAQRAARKLCGRLAERGQAYPGRQTLEQSRAEAGLEPGNRAGKRRLGDRQPLGCGADLSRFGDREEFHDIVPPVEHGLLSIAGLPTGCPSDIYLGLRRHRPHIVCGWGR